VIQHICVPSDRWKSAAEGAALLSPDSIKANIECSWSNPIFAPEDRDEAMIATFCVSGVYSTPLAMINCTTQPNNAMTHIFCYSIYAEMPDGHILLMDDGRFVSYEAVNHNFFQEPWRIGLVALRHPP
jgi:hypothetical protein